MTARVNTDRFGANAPRCDACSGPMATLDARTHPACDPSMPALRRASMRAALRREVKR